MKVQVTPVEALLCDLPDPPIINLTESVGVSSHMIGSGGPEHLSWLASGPGGHAGLPEEAILVVFNSWFASNIASTAHAGQPPSTATSKGVI